MATLSFALTISQKVTFSHLPFHTCVPILLRWQGCGCVALGGQQRVQDSSGFFKQPDVSAWQLRAAFVRKTVRAGGLGAVGAYGAEWLFGKQHPPFLGNQRLAMHFQFQFLQPLIYRSFIHCARPFEFSSFCTILLWVRNIHVYIGQWQCCINRIIESLDAFIRRTLPFKSILLPVQSDSLAKALNKVILQCLFPYAQIGCYRVPDHNYNMPASHRNPGSLVLELHGNCQNIHAVQ